MKLAMGRGLALIERIFAMPSARIGVCAIFVLSLLPSWTALSENLARAWPGLYAFTGPLNPLKIFLPFLVPIALLEVLRWSTRQRLYLGILIAVGTLSTLYAWYNCRPHTAILREGFVMGAGTIAALAFQKLTVSEKLRVATGWAVLLFVTCLFDIFSIGANTWLLQNIFDPSTALEGEEELQGGVILRGIFGRQSLAKLLAWVPFLVIAWRWKVRPSSVRELIWGFLILLAFGALILPTSQRGPFLGFACGVGLMGLLCLRSFPKKIVIPLMLAVIFGSFSIAWIRTDPAVWQSRVAPFLPKSDGRIDVETLRHSQGTVHVRKDMAIFSLQQIAVHPLGNACIPETTFQEHGLKPTHAHSLLLHQFLVRGWAWGALHLLVWILAISRALSVKSLSGFAWAGACTSILVTGLFDHPWFVLNHSIILSIVILECMKLTRRKEGGEPVGLDRTHD